MEIPVKHLANAEGQQSSYDGKAKSFPRVSWLVVATIGFAYAIRYLGLDCAKLIAHTQAALPDAQVAFVAGKTILGGGNPYSPLLAANPNLGFPYLWPPLVVELPRLSGRRRVCG
jgi:hypothetical protein